MAIREIKVGKGRLTARSSWGQRWFTLGGFHETVVIDLKAREIRNVEYRFWCRHLYRYAFDDLLAGEIDVDSSANCVELKSGVETQVYGFSFSMFGPEIGWIELFRFHCTRTIVPDLWVFFFGWLPFVQRDSIDDGMEKAKVIADYLTRHAQTPIRFHGYTERQVYGSWK